jgi:uncharacterized membrane protein YidH (DUF202 family)
MVTWPRKYNNIKYVARLVDGCGYYTKRCGSANAVEGTFTFDSANSLVSMGVWEYENVEESSNKNQGYRQELTWIFFSVELCVINPGIEALIVLLRYIQTG